MQTDWPEPSTPSATGKLGPTWSGWVAPSGAVFLSTSRLTGTRDFQVVAEADGPVHVAVVHALGTSCAVGVGSVRDRRIVFTASEIKSTSSGPVPVAFGAIGGALDDVPVVLRDLADGIGRNYYAGANAFFEWGGGLTLRSWTDGSPLATLSLPDPGDPGEPGFQGDALYFQIADLDYSRIKIYTPANGLRDLISYGNDVSHNAADFGTDGVDMLWVEGIGRSQGGIGQRFATYDIMTAPYTTDAAAVQKRRLRSSLFGAFRGSPFSVGCGYAARDYEDETTQGLRVIRLSDGWSWKLQTEMNARYWQAPVAVTCSEVFVNTLTPDGFNLARVRLDSLGTGEPPD
jgi:hypothetical protein